MLSGVVAVLPWENLLDSFHGDMWHPSLDEAPTAHHYIHIHPSVCSSINPSIHPSNDDIVDDRYLYRQLIRSVLILIHLSHNIRAPATLTFMHARVFVLNHSQLVDLPELLEDGLQVLLLQVPGDLPHEQLDGVRLLHRDGERGATRTGWGLGPGGRRGCRGAGVQGMWDGDGSQEYDSYPF